MVENRKQNLRSMDQIVRFMLDSETMILILENIRLMRVTLIVIGNVK